MSEFYKLNQSASDIKALLDALFSVSGILKSDGSGNITSASPGTDYISHEEVETFMQNLSNHVTNQSNPHAVNASQIGAMTYEGAVNLINTTFKNFLFVTSGLPTASADTMGRIYIVPADNPKQNCMYDKYITLLVNGVYKWEILGGSKEEIASVNEIKSYILGVTS